MCVSSGVYTLYTENIILNTLQQYTINVNWQCRRTGCARVWNTCVHTSRVSEFSQVYGFPCTTIMHILLYHHIYYNTYVYCILNTLITHICVPFTTISVVVQHVNHRHTCDDYVFRFSKILDKSSSELVFFFLFHSLSFSRYVTKWK